MAKLNFGTENLLTDLTPEILRDHNLDECVYKMLLYMVLQKKEKMVASADNLIELSKIQKTLATLKTFVYKNKG